MNVELTYVGFRAQVKIASRIVAYRIVSLTIVSKGSSCDVYYEDADAYN